MSGTKWLYSPIRAIYGLRNHPGFLVWGDLVVPLGYGLLRSNELPDAARETLREAVRISNEYQIPIAWASSNYFYPGCDTKEDSLKIEEALRAGLRRVPIIGESVTNTMTEAQSIRQAITKADLELEFGTIIVVVDWPHARRARKIWRKVFPEAKIHMVSVEGKWEKSHYVSVQRSELRWLFINIVHHITLTIFGTKSVSRLHYPVSK